jgi:hypothetical protein
VPGRSFYRRDLFSKEAESRAPYDLVVACEVLYYLKDVPRSLRRLQGLGRYCLVTYMSRDMNNLDPLVLSMPGVRSGIIEFQDAGWRVAYWPRSQS